MVINLSHTIKFVSINRFFLNTRKNRLTVHIKIVFIQNYLSCLFEKKLEKSVFHFPPSETNEFPPLPTEAILPHLRFDVLFLDQLFSMFNNKSRKSKLCSQFKPQAHLGLEGPETSPMLWFYILFLMWTISPFGNCNSLNLNSKDLT